MNRHEIPRYPNKLANKKWVFSKEYKRILDSRHFHTGPDFRSIGAWRWDGIYKHRKIIAKHVFDEKQVGVDFGGWHGPIGGYSKIIDFYAQNTMNMEKDDSLDYIFTSHTLEHIYNIEPLIRQMYKKLKKGGRIMVHQPRYTKEVWRAYYAPDHVHTFMLAEDANSIWFREHYRVPEDAPYEEDLVEIDTLLIDTGFKLIIAENVDPHCIFIYGEKL
jgi:SAM-dependent methyltransferase